jgi:hypothetical protein
MQRRVARPAHWHRLLWIVPAALMLLYAVAAVSLANIAYKAAPETVLRFYPIHAPTLSVAAAARALQLGDKTASAEAAALAREAVRQSPVSLPAARTLGTLAEAQGDNARAARLMAYADKLSRRDLLTEMWFIEDAVRRDDVAGALHRYDIALRTDRQAEGLLIPHLVQAATHDWMVPYLADLLRSDPEWGSDFADALIDAEIPAADKVRLTERLRGTRWFGAPFRGEFIGSLVQNGQYALAARVARKAPGYDQRLRRAFDLPATPGPFNWKLAGDYQITTSFDGAGEGRSLSIEISPDFGGTAAKVVTMLPAGRYRLDSALAGSLPAKTSAAWTVACAGRAGTPLATLDLREARSVALAVPAGCDAQQVSLLVQSASTGPDAIRLSVADLAIVPL